MSTLREMPKYKSHKEVWAFKIKSIEVQTNGDLKVTPEEEGYAPFMINDLEYITKHKPKVGGYYVVYEDGYKSFSPADAFESGNTLIKETSLIESLLLEERELGKKIAGVNVDLNSYGLCDKVGELHFELLSLQHSSMIAYRRVLNMRIRDLKSKEQ
jgi:hypothetical protein